MPKHFHTLKVARLIRETPDAVSITFEVPLALKDVFSYKAGQSLTLKVKVNNDEPRRSYSICSSPFNGEPITVTSKRVEGGLVSNFLNKNLKEGDIIEVLPPVGHFYAVPQKENALHYVLIGAGSGITPLMSILKTILLEEEKSKVTLVYGNRNEESIIFKKKLEDLQKKYPDRFTLIHTLTQPKSDWKGLKGRITRESLTKILQERLSTDIKNALFYLCGPNEMMQVAEKTLLNLSVFPGNIHHEYFTTPVNKEEEIVETKAENKVAEEVTSENIESVTIILDQEEHIVPINPSLKILHAAMEAGLEPPYSCRSGICSTCRAKLLSGRVKMDEREGLTEDEIKMGYILTCQSHPLTSNVKVDYE